MRFAKGHGTGNDFVILPDADPVDAALVAALCDRRRGIGGDGVLRVTREDGHWFMDYRNADGSIAEMCGNGIRVYARYLVDSGLASGPQITIGTRSGPVVAEVGPDSISVDMGLPKLVGESTATVGGQRLDGTAVDAGNPHLACPVTDLSTLDLSVPPTVDGEFFPEGVNVEFYIADGLDVRMRVHERGSGETQSCGSGAWAVATVVLRGAGQDRGTVTVDVPGGRLTATFDGTTCWLSGPAAIVARGEVDPAALVSA